MKIDSLDSNAIGNLGLVILQKIQLCQHSVIFHHMFKNAVYRSSYTYFSLNKKMYTYTDVVTVREIVIGLTLLKLMYVVINPQIAGRSPHNRDAHGFADSLRLQHSSLIDPFENLSTDMNTRE